MTDEPEEKPVEVKPLPVALQRLIDEIKLGEDNPPVGYNRVYNRHNRS